MAQEHTAPSTAAMDRTGAAPDKGRRPLWLVAEQVGIVATSAILVGALFGNWRCAAAAACAGCIVIATETGPKWRKHERGRVAWNEAARRAPTATQPLMHPLILQHQITPKTSRYTRCSMSMLPNVSINGRIRSSGQLGRWWYSISPCRNSECVRRFTVFAFNQRS